MGRRITTIIDGRKICPQCGIPYPRTLEHFGPHKRVHDGLMGTCRKCESERSSVKNRRLRAEMLQAYSGEQPCCACCGETEYSFLALDHINGGGSAEAREVGSWSGIILKLKREGWPPGYQILCHNCNHSKSILGICAHINW